MQTTFFIHDLHYLIAINESWKLSLGHHCYKAILQKGKGKNILFNDTLSTFELAYAVSITGLLG